jgi:hypothetical protein
LGTSAAFIAVIGNTNNTPDSPMIIRIDISPLLKSNLLCTRYQKRPGGNHGRISMQRCVHIICGLIANQRPARTEMLD